MPSSACRRESCAVPNRAAMNAILFAAQRLRGTPRRAFRDSPGSQEHMPRGGLAICAIVAFASVPNRAVENRLSHVHAVMHEEVVEPSAWSVSVTSWPRAGPKLGRKAFGPANSQTSCGRGRAERLSGRAIVMLHMHEARARDVGPASGTTPNMGMATNV